jgi:ribosomal protein L12E/L44/L45/RPP1/RPP2
MLVEENKARPRTSPSSRSTQPSHVREDTNMNEQEDKKEEEKKKEEDEDEDEDDVAETLIRMRRN